MLGKKYMVMVFCPTICNYHKEFDDIKEARKFMKSEKYFTALYQLKEEQ